MLCTMSFTIQAFANYSSQMQQYFASNIPREEYKGSCEDENDRPVELVASWRVEVGDEDQGKSSEPTFTAFHLNIAYHIIYLQL